MSFKVAVFGDFMVDRYLIGDATRISPEAPIPVVKIKDVLYLPGGAGNVEANLIALGVETIPYQGDSTVKPTKNRLMVDGYQVARWDQNDSCEPVGKLKDSLQDFDAIVVSDYDKGSVDQATIDYVKAHKNIVPIFVDTKGDPSVWSGVATAIFPNIKEAMDFGRYYNFDGLVVQKLGAKGICLYGDTKLIANSPAQARFVKSVNGAGDTVLAAFVYKYLVDSYSKLPSDPNSWEEILDFANAAAAIAVEHEYTYSPTLKEVEERYYGNS